MRTLDNDSFLQGRLRHSTYTRRALEVHIPGSNAPNTTQFLVALPAVSASVVGVVDLLFPFRYQTGISSNQYRELDRSLCVGILLFQQPIV